MKRAMIILVSLVLGLSVAAQDVIEGMYSYTYGDSESLVQAKKTCKDLAVRDAIESYYIFVESSTEVENSMLKEDIINTLSAGYLTNLTVSEESIEGRTITTAIEANVNAEDVQALVQKMAEAKKESAPAAADVPVASSQPKLDFTGALELYENQLAIADMRWQQQDYKVAYAEAQKAQKILEKIPISRATPFQKSLYLCVHKRNVMIRNLLRLEYAKEKNIDVSRRERIKIVLSDAKQLHEAMGSLKKFDNLTFKEKELQNKWLQRCEYTLERAKQKGVRQLRR